MIAADAARLCFGLSLMLVVACGSESESAPDLPRPLVCSSGAGDTTLACNGDASLCDRRYDEVSFASTHNSMSNADDHWAAPNQEHGIERQLADGVRGLMLDLHPYDGEAYLCHGVCGLGKRRLADALVALRAFLGCHPREVVTLIFESYVSADAVLKAFQEADLDRFARVQPLGAPWPTLAELTGAGTPLVVFTDAPEMTGPSWYLDQFAYGWQNPYAAKTQAELSCAVDRGSKDHPVFILNHFLTSPVATPDLAEMVNHDPFFLERVKSCQAETGRLPNFITVDFYGIGDLFSVTRAMNGLVQ